MPSTADLQWIVDAYSLAFAGAMLAAGVTGDRIGRKRTLVAGLAVFLVASVWCALSRSTGELIAARTLMGLGAAIVLPLSIAIVSVTFTDGERPKAIGITTAAVALGLPLGPIVGGLLLQHFAWPSVFWINVPVAALTLAACTALLPETRNPAAPRLDVPGVILSAAAIVSLVFGVIRGPEHGWSSPLTIASLAASGILLAGFLVHERRAASPLIDPSLFRDRRFSWGTIATVAVSVALFGILFVLPQYFQSVHGYDALNAGIRLLPLMAGLLAGGSATSVIVKAIGTKVTVAAGLAVLAAGLLVLGQVRLATGYTVVAAGLALAGAGVGASIAAAMNTVMASVRRRRGRDGRVGEQHLAPGRRRPGGGSAGQRAVSRLHQGPAPVPRDPARWRRRHCQRLHHPGQTGRRAPRHGRRRATAGGRNSVPPRHEHRHDQLRGGCRPRCHHQPGLPTARRRGGQRCRAPGTRR